jgi:hypothetical protein
MGVFIAEFGDAPVGMRWSGGGNDRVALRSFNFFSAPRGARKKIETGEKLWGTVL